MSGGSSNKKPTVWLIAGTTEGRQIASALCDRGIDVLATVTTDAGEQILAKSCPDIRIGVGLFDAAAMTELISREKVGLIVDATHPYAHMASRNALAASAQRDIPYIRYERPPAAPADYPLLQRAADFESAASMAAAFGSTVFLTVGSRNIRPFVREARKAGVNLVARILDDPASRKIAKEAGLADEELRFFRGVFAEEWDSGYLGEIGASVMVCKDSGVQGGTAQKIDACRRAGVPVLVVDRPAITYPAACSDPEEVIAWVGSWAEGRRNWES